MAASDVIVVPSHYESFGIVLVEAMALARPVVASTAGSIPEVLEEGVHGYLVPPGHADLLSQRIRDMVQNPIGAQRMGEAARQRVLQRFTADYMADQIAQLYYRLAETGSLETVMSSQSGSAFSVSTPLDRV